MDVFINGIRYIPAESFKPESTDFKVFRKENGMTQKDLAEALDISQSYLSEIERGIKTPSKMLIKYFNLITEKQK